MQTVTRYFKEQKTYNANSNLSKIILNYNSNIVLSLTPLDDFTIDTEAYYYLAIDIDFDLSTDPLLVQVDNYSISDNVLTFTLDTNIAAISTALGVTKSIDAYICIWSTKSDEDNKLVLHDSITILNTAS